MIIKTLASPVNVAFLYLEAPFVKIIGPDISYKIKVLYAFFENQFINNSLDSPWDGNKISIILGTKHLNHIPKVSKFHGEK